MITVESSTRRGLLLSAGAAGLALAGCGEGSTKEGAAPAAASGGFPVRIEGQFGTTTKTAGDYL